MTLTRPPGPADRDTSSRAELIIQSATVATEAPRHNRRKWRGALASYVVMVYVLITLNFLLPRLMPGNPIDSLLAQSSATFSFGEPVRKKLENYYHLKGSLASQYGHYLSRLLHGDLGTSIETNTSVWHEMSRRIPWTVLLIGSSIVISLLIGMILGVQAGWNRDRPVDRALMTGLITVWQFPPYLLGSILILVFVVKLGWFPDYGGQVPQFQHFSLPQRALDIGNHLVLPLVVLVASLAAYNYLLMRSGMVSELGADYLQLGRAKGLRERRLKYRYAARNALLPVVSNVAIDVGIAVAANVVIEKVFSYPGLGSMMFGSIAVRDYPVTQGVFLLLSLGIVTINALADVLYGRLDPRTLR